MSSAALSAKVARLSALIQRISLLRLARQGLLAFAVLFLAHLLTDPCGAYHEQLCAQLDWAVAPGHRLLGALPREHAKTTLGTVALVLRELCLGADSPSGSKRNILLVSANREEAVGKLRQVVHELECNARLAAAFGAKIRPLRDAHGRNVAYADHCIVLAGGQRVGVLGFGGKVRGQLSAGRRLDLIVLDDPEDDNSVASPRIREKLRRWVDQALLNALDIDRGSVVWLGSLLHHDCVLAQKMNEHESRLQVTGDRLQLIEDRLQGTENREQKEGNLAETCHLSPVISGREQVTAKTGFNCNLKPVTCNLTEPWRVLRLPAISDEGTPLWPERWSLAKLAARKAEIGERAFAQEYQNQPVSLSTQVFKPENFGSYDPAGLLHRAGEWTLDSVPLTVAIGVDPAIGEQAQHDWFAAVVLGLTRATDAGWRITEDRARLPLVFVLDVLRIKQPFAAQLQQLTALARRWSPRVIGIEAVAYQAALAQAAWNVGLAVQPVSGVSRKCARIEAAAVHQTDGRMLLPCAGAWVATFRQEAAEYPAGSHDDQLDALARALEVGLPLIGGAWNIAAAGAARDEVKGFV